jgi:multidrug efflux pump subunit AcrB
LDYLHQLNISVNEIKEAINKQFKQTNLSNIKDKNAFISVSLKQKSNRNTWHIPIKKVGNRIVYLTDIATVNRQEQEPNSYLRINGKNSVYISITPDKNVNTIVLSNKIADKINHLQQTLPKDFKIIKTYDDTTYVKKELQKIYKRSFYTILILLIFILLVTRSFKYLWITIISLIANLSIAFIFFWLFKIEIQLYSLAGLTISLGLILDNSIVMIDHIKNTGNKNVFIPIFASTLTTIGALSIIYFLKDNLKLNLIDFALVIIINLGVSLFIALFLIPSLLDKINLKQQQKQKNFTLWNTIYTSLLKVILKYKKISIAFIILLFGIPFFMLPQKLDSNKTWYQKAYNTTLGNTWYLENVRPYLDKYLGGSFRLFNYYVFEQAQYNRNEQTKLYVSASMEKGATVHQMNEVFIQIENYLYQFNEIEQFTTKVYSGDYANIQIRFKPAYENSSFPYILKSKLIRKALDLGGLNWNIYGVGNGFSNGGGANMPVNFTVLASGYNYNELNKWADTLKQKLLKHPRIQQVDIRDNSRWKRKPSYSYVVNLDNEKLALYHNTPFDLYHSLKDYTLSKYPDLRVMFDNLYLPIRLQSVESKNFDFWHVKNTFLNAKEHPIKLNDIAIIKKEKEEENIFKENQEYLRKIEFQYTGSTKFGGKYLDKVLNEIQYQLPLGYQFKRKDFNWYFSSDKDNNYFVLLLLVLVIIYFITAILFESLKQPFIILSTIPISFIGVFLTFYLFDFNFDQGGMASFVLLSGLTVNAAIYILNEYNLIIKKQKFTKMDSFLLAFNQKIFPIILTILSTIFGFIPFILNGQKEVFWFALAAGTIGGLLFSLIAITFYLPLFLLKKEV